MNDIQRTPPTTTADALMQRLSERATKIFAALVAGIPVGDARKLDKARGFMAVSVDHLYRCGAGSLYAVAHRYEVNGDLVPDPDVEFYVVADASQPVGIAVYPTGIDHGPLGYHRYVHFDSEGAPGRVSRRGQASLATFCDGWMSNIAEQQGMVLS